MALPRTPFAGLIARCAFLWSDEARAGRTEVRKDRPCVIVLTMQRETDRRLRVRVVPGGFQNPGARYVQHIARVMGSEVGDLRVHVFGSELGAHAFLRKPIDPVVLISTVRDLLGTSALTRKTSHASRP